MPLRRILRYAPWPVRRRVLTSVQHRLLPRLAPERRLRTARLVVPLAPRTRLRLAGPTATMPVRTRHGRLVARRAAQATPAGVRRENLDRVVAALDTAGVEWFRVPGESLTGTALAVPEEDRNRVVAALEALSATDAGLLEVVAPAGRRGRRARRGAQVLRMSWPVTDPRGSLVLGPEYGCEIEFWRAENGNLVGPRSNPVADVVPADEPVVYAPEPVFGPFCAPDDTTLVPHPGGVHDGQPRPGRASRSTWSTPGWTASDPAWRERKAAGAARERLGRRGQRADRERLPLRLPGRAALLAARAARVRALGAARLPGHRRPGAGLAGHRRTGG